jgi:WD40 repeat protein
VTDIKIGKNGMMMVSVAGREMIFWNISNLKSLYHFRFDFGTFILMLDIEHVLLVDSFEYLFLLSDKTVRQIDTEDNKELFKFTINDKIQCGLVFLNYLIVASNKCPYPAEKGEIKVWNHGHYEFCIHFKAHDLRVKDMKHVAVEDGDFLVTADSNGVIRVWDIL